MDALTHGLASYCVTRATFPRASRVTLGAAVLAGMAADVDRLSVYWGPAAFLKWHRTAAHSVVGTLVIVVAFFLLTVLATRNKRSTDSIRTIALALLFTSFLHLAMDLTHNETVQLL